MLGNSPSFYVQSSCLSFASCRCSVAKVYGIYVTYVSFSCLYCSFLSSGLLSHGLESCSDVSAFCWSAFLSSMYMLIPDILIKGFTQFMLSGDPLPLSQLLYLIDSSFYKSLVCALLFVFLVLLPKLSTHRTVMGSSHGIIALHTFPCNLPFQPGLSISISLL